jgi:GTP1/Obg family GTP-binding protein
MAVPLFDAPLHGANEVEKALLALAFVNERVIYQFVGGANDKQMMNAD